MAPHSKSSLPLEPPAYSQLLQDNEKLQERNKFLEEVIEVLSVQNQQHLNTIKRYQSHEKVLRKKVGGILSVARDLKETHEGSCTYLRESDEKTLRVWDQFCDKKKTELTPGSADPWEYWKNLKLRIMTKTYQDLVLNQNSDIRLEWTL